MYIDTQKDLQKLCAELKKAKIIYFDTEFMRERTFYAQLCLIQLRYDDVNVVVDPLAKDIDLKPLLSILTSKTKLIVFHAGKQDLEILFELSGKLPPKIFDTQIAAMVCGFGEQAGYQQLVEKIVGKKVDKTQRFTDWSKRPLTKKQIKYAIDDVEYLPEIYEKLSTELKEKKRSKWLEEEEAILTDKKTYKEDPAKLWEKIKHRDKKQADLGVVSELAKWREKRAIELDKPRRHILRDEAIIEVAIKHVFEVKQLKNMRNKIHVSRETLEEICKTAAKGYKLPEAKKPKIKPGKRSNANPLVLDLLKLLLKKTAHENDVAPKLICSNGDLEQFADTGKADFTKGWRGDIFGKEAKKLLQGKLAFSVKKGKLEIS